MHIKFESNSNFHTFYYRYYTSFYDTYNLKINFISPHLQLTFGPTNNFPSALHDIAPILDINIEIL